MKGKATVVAGYKNPYSDRDRGKMVSTMPAYVMWSEYGETLSVRRATAHRFGSNETN